MNMSTILEIYTNPYDLEFTVGQIEDGEKFALAIFRGPGHDYKVLITSQPFADTKEGATDVIKSILEFIIESAEGQLSDSNSLASRYLNPDNKPVDKTLILNPALIEKIVKELQAKDKASTCRMQNA